MSKPTATDTQRAEAERLVHLVLADCDPDNCISLLSTRRLFHTLIVERDAMERGRDEAREAFVALTLSCVADDDKADDELTALRTVLENVALHVADGEPSCWCNGHESTRPYQHKASCLDARTALGHDALVKGEAPAEEKP